ncbi:hypothetical protein M446_4296 [Methylobacterium sp. 4-46]|nr:hypothetical protein M446_4296 [Methylobacterium sp. 4-46]
MRILSIAATILTVLTVLILSAAFRLTLAPLRAVRGLKLRRQVTGPAAPAAVR